MARKNRRKYEKTSYSDSRNNENNYLIFHNNREYIEEECPLESMDREYYEHYEKIFLNNEINKKMSHGDLLHYSSYKKKISSGEYLDRANVQRNIKQHYVGYEFDDEHRRNDYEWSIRDDDGIYYDLYRADCMKGIYCNIKEESKTYYCCYDGHHCIYCNRKCECDMKHDIDPKYHRYNDKTGIWEHIKRLPDIKANISWKLVKGSVNEILSERNYVLDRQFYWKYILENGGEWVIKFYPNLHDDHKYLTNKVNKKMDEEYNQIIEERFLRRGRGLSKIVHIFYMLNKMPIDIQNIIIERL